jgi:uncharacterized protein
MFKILSLDGGGIRGILTATILERLSLALPNWLDQVDLIAGTSTGGIIALGLAAGMPPTQLKALYYDKGQDIFDSSWLWDIESIDGATGAKYDNKKLKLILESTFGSKVLGDLNKKVVIPTFDLKATTNDGVCWSPRLQHNYLGQCSDINTPVVLAALRTSAAPVYFPSVESFIDGGVVANDPAMAALGIAIEQNNGLDLSNVALLSIGTGKALNSVDGQDHDWGAVEWVTKGKLIDLLLDTNVSLAEIQCKQFLNDRYLRSSPVLPPPPVGLDAWKQKDALVSIGQSSDISGIVTWLSKNWK